MRVKIGVIWEQIRDSLWLVPAVCTVISIVLAFGMVAVDRRLLAAGRADIYLAFGGGTEGARGVLTAIGSTVITVTGVIFSVTIVALQLASSQYSPRVLRSFMGDRANQLVLGVFIGTFTYTLLVLRTVRSASDDGASFVPSLAVAGAIGLALVSIGLLIYFVHHVARSIQAAVIIDRAVRDTRQVSDRLFPPAEEPAEPPFGESGIPIGLPVSVAANCAGYIQAIDEDALFELACRQQHTVRVERRVGEHLLPGTTIASLWPATLLSDDLIEVIRQAFVLGPDRTLLHDPELGVRQLTDIALRALSPSLNDPTTAMICFDRLAEILARIGSCPTPATVRRENGATLVMRRQTFDDLVTSVFGLTRRPVAADPNVARHVLHVLGRVGTAVRLEHRASLIRQIRALHAAVEATPYLPAEIEPIRQAAAESLSSLAAPDETPASTPEMVAVS